MAITLRGVAENSGSNGGAFSITHPVGTAENDVVFVTYGQENQTDRDLVITTTGYTELADLYANDAFDINLGVFRKVMGATPDSTVAIPANPSFGQANVGVEMVLTCVDTTTPEDATTTTATGTDSAIPDSPSITTVTDAAWVLACGGSTISDTSVTAPSGYSNQVDRNDAPFTGAHATVGMASLEKATAGAENPAAWTDWSTNTNSSWAAATVAVRPAGGAPEPVIGGLLHHIESGMGDTGEGARLPQTLHTIEHGIALANENEPERLAA